MKKVVATLTLLTLFLSTAVFSEAELLKSSDGNYEYTADGVITAYYGEEIVTVPAEIDGVKIKKIGEMIFFDLEISSVYIEAGIEEIGKSAFEGCNIEYANIPSTLTIIRDSAFANCANLSEITLGSEQIVFGRNVFSGIGYIDFCVPCTADKDALKRKISTAKGDDNFGISEFHSNLAESMTEKDIYGENMIYCEDCGFKGSKYSENIRLPFSDVSDDAWYYPYIQTAYSFGIINGKSESVFDPDTGLTCAEAAKIAAMIHSRSRNDNKDNNKEDIFSPMGSNWYDVYVNYCYENAILEDYIVFDWNKNATRAQMAYLFSRCDANRDYINEVPLTDIPDVYDTTPFAYEILDLYNKGIAVGSNEHMAYYPDSQVKRSEAAALISRILCCDMRIELPKG